MTNKSLISIVLPTYNGSRYLNSSIESILKQTYQQWELIIVDDASTDDSPAIIQKFVEADKRIRSIRHEINMKLPAALNSGFSTTQGDLLTWTSDDNLFQPEAFHEMVTFLDNRPDIDFVYTDYTIIDEHDSPKQFISVLPFENLVDGNCVGGCFLYRRYVQEKVGNYSEKFFLAEDYDFWLRASISFKLEPLHKNLYLYRHHNSSLTEKNRDKAMYVLYQSYVKHLPNLHWADRKVQARGLIRRAFYTGKYGEIVEMWKQLFQTIWKCPEIVINPVTAGLIVEMIFGHRMFLAIQRLFWIIRKPASYNWL